MLSNYQLFALSEMWGTLPIVGAASLVYYLVPGPQSAIRRLLAASHGIFLLLAVGYAIAISPISSGRLLFMPPFWLLIVMSIASMIYALFQYRRWYMLVHVLLLALLPSAFWIWFVGTMTIVHDWI